jgi:DNA-binding MarR family transcriptional regulator
METLAPVPTQAWRLEHSGRLLLQNSVSYERQTIVGLQLAGFADLRKVHVNVTRHLDVDGTRMTELAKRLQVTKAAITALVAECEKDGYVKVDVDSTDRRARVVRFTRKGHRLLEAFKKLVNLLEGELGQILGERDYKIFRQALFLMRDKFDAAIVTRFRHRDIGHRVSSRSAEPTLSPRDAPTGSS